ncbi:LysR substrate-binding domain-containing protein, partial [Acinetobacter baumannii]
GPQIAEIQRELDALSDLREKPSGTIRLTASEHAAESILWPAVTGLVNKHPDIKVEIVIDYGLTDIVGERFDAGVRPGETIAKDMITIP